MTVDSDLYFRVVGVTFVDGYPENLHRLRVVANERENTDEPLTALLIRNPHNIADRNAIEIHAPAIGRLGSVPADFAVWLAPQLDEGVPWVAHIEGVFINDDHPDRPGVSVGLRRLT